MISDSAHCLRCGSADTVPDSERGQDIDLGEVASEPLPKGDGVEVWYCFRCEKTFTPHSCPSCGSFRVEGSVAVSGQPLERPMAVVRCFACGEEFPPHPAYTGGSS